ncbi:MAG: tRNA (N(6)-L-threonylcarbamoyladenosine(37)-C(2))-methylthiotransferase MtaB [Spirochaetaceae bacterium]|nr:MAG: tRNA (N(6)-L-threonylcarbamoyladenosine(37)-C(2))-methylthiotransferase MtaB [Spirochaetaceae bacterium]
MALELANDGRRIAFQTLGCRLNQFETDSLASEFEHAGYTVVPFEEHADAYVVNSCTVTNKADRKTRNSIHRAARRGDALVVVTGCFAENHKRELQQQPGTLTVDNARKRHVVDLVDAHLRGEIPQPQLLQPDLFSYSVPEPIFHTRSMVKIQEGCDNYCTFCIIPYVRGRAVSREPSEILDHVRRSLDRGYKEIVVTGVNISRYRYAETGFSLLIEQLLEIDADFRLRISSMEPDSLDDRFFALLEHPRMSPHLHLCLQSGSERMLLKMRRQYSAAQYAQMVGRIRARQPDFNITTDVIVGFPGETEADFAATCALCRELQFGHIHTFSYSRRSGTRADRMPDQIADSIKRERSEQVRRIGTVSKQRYRARFVGRCQRMLIEQIDEQLGCARGYGQHYLPLAIEPQGQQRNSFVTVKVTQLDTTDDPLLRATPV